QQDTILRVGDLEMDVATREVRRAGKSINLSPREFTLLEYLMRHPRQVLTRSQITEHTWNFDFYENSNVIDVYIGYLRRKIDKGFDKPLLHTVRGVGYCLSADAAND
ncbi:MAG: response regulator transcription factor, partial [Fischerella sp.]|nr:response regulator transcription factor [Fischerella sp.]